VRGLGTQLRGAGGGEYDTCVVFEGSREPIVSRGGGRIPHAGEWGGAGKFDGLSYLPEGAGDPKEGGGQPGGESVALGKGLRSSGSVGGSGLATGPGGPIPDLRNLHHHVEVLHILHSVRFVGLV
jgi:hypothetical protein